MPWNGNSPGTAEVEVREDVRRSKATRDQAIIAVSNTAPPDSAPSDSTPSDPPTEPPTLEQVVVAPALQTEPVGNRVGRVAKVRESAVEIV